MNKIILMGRLTKDPESRMTQTQTQVTRYSLAVDRPYHKDGEQDVDFIDVSAFGKRAEFAGKYFKKGRQVAVVGELHIDKYQDRHGITRYSTYVTASEQYFADSRQSEEWQPAEEQAPFDAASLRDSIETGYQQRVDEDIQEDVDLPF